LDGEESQPCSADPQHPPECSRCIYRIYEEISTKGLFIMFENNWWLHLKIFGLDIEMPREAGRDEPRVLIKENV
jgi:hypothetical protein